MIVQLNMNMKMPQNNMMSNPVSNLPAKVGWPWNPRATALGLGLLLGLLLGLTALDILVPRALGNGRNALARAGWYLRNHQWQADVQTLLCAVEYVISPEAEIPTETDSPTQLLAEPSPRIGPQFPTVNHGEAGVPTVPTAHPGA